MSGTREARHWTLEEMHALPEDGNKYELIYGELLVTPAPTDNHETIAARLTRILDPYVATHDLGLVYRPRAVFRIGREVEVEPDLMVRQLHPEPEGAWERAPRPSLIVEILSVSSRRHDFGKKRALYLMSGIPDYWIVDGIARTITVIRPAHEAVILKRELVWAPSGASAPLTFELREIFG
ncbi:MAG: Uma2 family endonuclease [Phycisphaerae bacterium]|nr:Uma2 family endonuclease [Gemmatimonadaceae bacterium]